jgi:hypothetical protein
LWKVWGWWLSLSGCFVDWRPFVVKEDGEKEVL